MSDLIAFLRQAASNPAGTDIGAEFAELSVFPRLLLIVLLTVFAAVIVGVFKRMLQSLFSGTQSGDTPQERFLRNRPRLATTSGLILSIVTFGVYLLALGLILAQFNVSVTAYLAGASVIGLALAFGIQGLIQDIVIGLTVTFASAVHVEDIVEVGGVIGTVRSVGLRYTTLATFDGKQVIIPNRTLGAVTRFPGGFSRLFVDIQLPPGDTNTTVSTALSVCRGLYRQFRSIILAPPVPIGIGGKKDAVWQYVRIEFRVWPGQHATIEPTIRGHLEAAMKKVNPGYADWMITFTSKAHAAD
jgi:small conductance mechanosensitive channel